MTVTLTLLGDSIIDNKAYVKAGEDDVAQQIARRAPELRVDMRAVDGAVSAEVLRHQVATPLNAAGLVVLSAGGNDALNQIHVIEETAERPAAELLGALWEVRRAFRRDYAALLGRIAAGLGSARSQALVCTIYDPAFRVFGLGEALQRGAETALALFNDVIQTEARAHGFGVLELRRLCTEAEDFANPIEPSAVGGAKIADAVVAWARASGRPGLAPPPG